MRYDNRMVARRSQCGSCQAAERTPQRGGPCFFSCLRFEVATWTRHFEIRYLIGQPARTTSFIGDRIIDVGAFCLGKNALKRHWCSAQHFAALAGLNLQRDKLSAHRMETLRGLSNILGNCNWSWHPPFSSQGSTGEGQQLERQGLFFFQRG
jgi:hypothetical protein